MGGKNSGNGTKPRNVAPRYRPSFLSDLDGRYPVARGLKYRLKCYVSDLGGIETLSRMEETLVKRIVHLEHFVELKESALVNGGPMAVGEYLLAVNCLSGLLSKIGLKRRAKQISLTDYLHDKTVPKPTTKEET